MSLYYNFCYSIRQDRREGGITAIYSNKFTCTGVDPGSLYSFEYLAFVLNTDPMVINFYRPPRQSSSFAEFSDLLSLLFTSYGRIIINGDLNIHLNNKVDPKAMEFINLLEKLDITQYVTVATRQGNILDLVVSWGLGIENVTVSDVTIPDLYCVFLNFYAALPITTNVRESTVKKWVLDSTAEVRFSQLVNSFDV